MPARLAASFTTSHSTFGVMPSPHTRPDLLIERNTVPSVIPAAVLQTSTAALTHCGTGTVRMCPALPFRSVLLANLDGIHRQRQKLAAPEAATDEHRQNGMVPLSA